ncbi:MAG: hypothetical protein HC788_07755, partial [Sphingopyxis sp.]|nr:hypothetical protein [Sphingopyxis sp.]
MRPTFPQRSARCRIVDADIEIEINPAAGSAAKVDAHPDAKPGSETARAAADP